MGVDVNVIEDSLAPNGVRLTTMQLRYPRFIHAEFMTHRVFSRNASSSRAVPVAKMIGQIRDQPAMPVHWGMNRAGMQAHSEVEGAEREQAIAAWMDAARNAADTAERMASLGLHKQIANRILEPFMFISVIVTATEWDNFFELRAHPDAQPEIHLLAVRMQEAMAASTPRQVPSGGDSAAVWHLPYVTVEERADGGMGPLELAKISAARCARVSYLTHDGAKPSVEKDLALYDRLVGSRPLHASPVEHQATPMPLASEWSRNFRGWKQFRAVVEQAIPPAA